jgi:SHS2 domain-containing protein
MAWSHFSHDADIGLRGRGPSKASAFEEIATALTAVTTDVSQVQARRSIRVICEAPSDEVLLVDWLNALIYEMAVRKMLFCDFDVKLSNGKLLANVKGEPVDLTRHQPAVEVKGATFTALAVRQNNDEWVVECVVDV